MALDLGSGFIDVLPRTDKFAATLQAKISPVLQGVTGASAVAATAIAGIGVASVKLASDFENSMNKIQALVGLSAQAVHGLSDEVLNLAQTVPVAPKELADALFFIESAGLRGERALSALKFSAMAAAAGLGDTKTVADAVTSAMNAYATSGLTAARATDILVAAVREGKLPPEDLAAAIGQVLPVAAELGITFDQVAAGIASATREGLQASRAATGIRFLLSSFIKPSTQASDALNSIGLSVSDLQAQLVKEGLLATLQSLADKLDLSTAAGKQAFATIVGGARGMTVASILIGQNGDAIQGIFDRVRDSAGSTAKAFDVAMETLSNRFKLLVSQLTVLGIRIGTVLIPVLIKVVDVTTALLPLITRVGAAFLAYRALGVIPPILLGIASALDKVGLFGAARGFNVAAGAALAAGGALSSLAIAIASVLAANPVAAAAAVTTLAERLGLVESPAESAAKGLQALNDSMLEISKITEGQARFNIESFVGTIRQFGIEAPRFGGSWTKAAQQVNEALAAAGSRFRVTTDDLQGLVQGGGAAADVVARLNAEFGKSPESVRALNDALAVAGKAFPGLRQGIADVANVTGQTFATVFQQLRGTLQGTTVDEEKWQQATQDIMQKAADSITQFRDQAQESLTGIGSFLGELASRANITTGQIDAAFRKQAALVRSFGHDLLTIAKTGGDAGKALAQQLLQLGPSAAAFASKIADSGKKTRDRLIGDFGSIVSAGDRLAGRLTDAIVGTLDDIKTILQQIAKHWGVNVDLHDGASGPLTQLEQRLNRLQQTTYTAHIRLIQGQAEGGIIPGLARGGLVPAMNGLITRPTILAGEGNRAEALIQPLQSQHGIEVGALWLERAIQRLHSGQDSGDLERAFLNALRRYGQERGTETLRIADWRRGVASLDAENQWAAATSGWGD